MLTKVSEVFGENASTEVLLAEKQNISPQLFVSKLVHYNYEMCMLLCTELVGRRIYVPELHIRRLQTIRLHNNYYITEIEAKLKALRELNKLNTLAKT